MKTMKLALCATALGMAGVAIAQAPSPASAPAALKSVIDDEWAWFLKNSPIYATMLGQPTDDGSLGEVSLTSQDRQAKEAEGFIARLDRIPDGGLDAAGRTNKAIMRRILAEQVEGNRFGQRMIMFGNTGGIHSQLPDLANFVPLRTRADYEHLLQRFEQYPRINDDVIAISAQAVAKGYVQPCDAMGSFERTITGVISDDPLKSPLYQAFTRPKPRDASDADWAALQARARKDITTLINPANAKLLAFYRKDYAPKCAKSVGISAQPGGAAYYDFKIRQQTTTNLTADQIHQLGLKEVARIRGEMDALAKKSGYPSREAFISKLRTDPQYYAKTPEELMRASARLTKTIDSKMPTLFGKLPRLPYGIREIPAETAEGNTTAYYMPGSPQAGIAGTYYVNTTHLDQRPFWEQTALTLHEAVPGHHNQIALQQELDLPEFRKNQVSFTAFVEGWGLYSERLGIEMGLYDTPEKDMGRLSYEMWRACRLVVDTGLHAKGWTKAQAVKFMTDNTALSAANIDAEVNRYIAGPGQALAYKLGELKIRELRARAETALGPKFDLRHFHDAVLAQGPVPLDVLDKQIDAWIASEKAKG